MFLITNKINIYSRKISQGVVFAERFNRTVRDLSNRPVFEKCENNWIDVLSVITRQ